MGGSHKIITAIRIGAGRCRNAVEMCAIARDLSLDDMPQNPTALTNINVNSPRKLDDAMADVGPGGHFFGCDHTIARFQDAFYEPMLSD